MVTIFVEGGRKQDKALSSKCREGFRKFLEKAGLKGRMPTIFASGGGGEAYKDFCNALRDREPCMLLVDSEEPVQAPCQSEDNPEQWNPWLHLKNRKNNRVETPEDAKSADCHLMVQCMENWLLADRACLQEFFGQDFHANALPPESSPIESLGTERVRNALAKASKDCKKGAYSKGKHSFELLARIDPEKVMRASPWARRFVTAVKKKMGSAHAA